MPPIRRHRKFLFFGCTGFPLCHVRFPFCGGVAVAHSAKSFEAKLSQVSFYPRVLPACAEQRVKKRERVLHVFVPKSLMMFAFPSFPSASFNTPLHSVARAFLRFYRLPHAQRFSILPSRNQSWKHRAAYFFR
jgi:hypothetical protein